MLKKKWAMLLSLGVMALALAIAVPMITGGATVEGMPMPEVKIRGDAKAVDPVVHGPAGDNDLGDKVKIRASCPLPDGCSGSQLSRGKAEYKTAGGGITKLPIDCVQQLGTDIRFYTGTTGTGFSVCDEGTTGTLLATLELDTQGAQMITVEGGAGLLSLSEHVFGDANLDPVKAKIDQKP